MQVVDDLHWADKASLMLLQFITRELSGARLLLVGTYRDVELNRQHPLAETLGELTREKLFQRVLLRGLSHQDVERFIEVTTGIDRLLQRGGGSDRARAMSLLDEVLAISSELGMRPLMERVLSRREILGA